MLKTIILKTKVENYNPEIMIVTVNKKINSRFFSSDKSKKVP